MSIDDYLLISGIQHFSFCRRQWALIHVEGLWKENILTAQGRLIHKRVDNPLDDEHLDGVIINRSVPVASDSLGIYGVADLVEFKEDLHTKEIVCYPIEYKRGKVKLSNYDRLQLCAIARCLEEMMGISINKGYIYYNQIRRRETIIFDDSLREELVETISEMRYMYDNKTTPKESYSKKCRRCSLLDLCMPKELNRSVQYYIDKIVSGDNFENPS